MISPELEYRPNKSSYDAVDIDLRERGIESTLVHVYHVLCLMAKGIQDDRTQGWSIGDIRSISEEQFRRLQEIVDDPYEYGGQGGAEKLARVKRIAGYHIGKYREWLDDAFKEYEASLTK